MANQTLASMTAASSLTGTELFYAVQGSSNVKVTAAQIADASPSPTPSALTRTNDTNVTLTLGGSPNTALLNAASITAGWSGNLAETRGGTGQTTYAKGDLLVSPGANTLAKLPVGSDGQILTAASSVTNGVLWGTAPATGALLLTGTMTFYVSILSGTIGGGGGYADGTYNNVSLTGGTGAGATANITVTSGAVSDVVPVSQGAGYIIGNVLSANPADIGGGLGFTYTLTGIGNDSNAGTSVATAFRTIQKAHDEISKYNLALGYTVTVHVADGFYVEQPLFRNIIGAVQDQIVWIGNTTKRENVHVKPNAQAPGRPTGYLFSVISFSSATGHSIKGFWFDAQDAGFGGWQPCGGIENCDITIDQCRFSAVTDGHWNVFLFAGGHYRLSNLTFDFAGGQANFLSGDNIIINFSGTMTLLSATPAIDSNAFFYEVIHDSRLIFSQNENSWIGWAGTTGKRWSLQTGSAIIQRYGGQEYTPGDAQGYFWGNNSTYGSLYESQASPVGNTASFGAVLLSSFPSVGNGTRLLVPDQYGIFSTSNNGFCLSINNNGTPLHVSLDQVGTNYNYQVPLTGFSITLGNNYGQVILDSSSALATGTITMSSNPVDGQRVEVYTSQTITTLTVSPNAGQSVMTAPTTLAAGKKFSSLYRSTNSTWYCAS